MPCGPKSFVPCTARAVVIHHEGFSMPANTGQERSTSMAPLVHMERHLFLRLQAALANTDTNLISARREFIRRQVRDVGDSSVFLRLRQWRLSRTKVLSFSIEGHCELRSILDRPVWIHGKVERQNVTWTAL